MGISRSTLISPLAGATPEQRYSKECFGAYVGV